MHALEVGLRCCFYWLSNNAERSMGAADRAAWMEASGKGHCQDAVAACQDFARTSGTTFAGGRTGRFSYARTWLLHAACILQGDVPACAP